ncbi:GH51 arabinofuranosidase [Coniochaeta hoffmannii]|uniref:non-reducing end alpha-L-arabinofuranosidase n=1 Tax=Coniochaeta hoffmannii TaxID=91930 RepID=A0AA38VQH4_9PEZI|nr:GH51 arabinofuranosidase [Coniochaeta hoffmannii]
MRPLTAAATAALAFASSCNAANLVVQATGGNNSSPLMYGLMHEDISNSGDGGIYAELIYNRAFQGSDMYPSNLAGWIPVNGASLSLQRLATPLSWALPYSMNVAATASSGKIGFANTGYWGMDVKMQTYSGSFYVKGVYEGSFTASLQSNLTGDVFGSVDVVSQSVAGEWTQHNFTLVPSKAAPNSNNTFAITFDPTGVKDGSLDFNFISLFPPTYKNRPYGLRPDIMEAFAELNPKFLRLPGGNMLEGNTQTSWWKWNETIGPLKDRPGMANVWGYQITYGLGLVEYMEWCEDLGLEPIVAVWDGLSLDGSFTPQAELEQWVQFALDEIEFLTGDAATTKWGAVRASVGHPEPWIVKYVEIGNEDWLAGAPAAYDAYKQYRLPMFIDAITAKYPDIQVISSSSVFDNITIPEPAAGDYHSYVEPDTFVNAFGMFDQLTAGNKTLIGEYAAVHPNGGIGWNGDLMPFPWWGGAVGEAIFLLGAERNGDRIIGTTYAPSLRNMNRWQWSVTLLQFAADPALTTRSTSWYTLRLFGNHVISKTLPVTSDAEFGPLYHVAGTSSKGTGILKAAVYNSTADVPVSLRFEGSSKGATATLTVLTGPENPYGYNDPFTHVNVVKETTSTVTAGADGSFHFSLPQLSVAVLETDATVKCRKQRRVEVQA